MKTWKAFLVQLLNIAGTGPIFGSILTAIPAAFMSAVCMTYILTAGEGFGISTKIAVPVGVCFAAALLIVYIVLWTRSQKHGRERLL